ncbi:MAG: sulfatase [Opitutales bacterium]
MATLILLMHVPRQANHFHPEAFSGIAVGHGLAKSLALALSVLLLAIVSRAQPASATAPDAPPNVLFIMVDDLRPELGCYGAQHMVTPNIDRLAAEGFRFERAYVQQALCSPSRISILSGLRPDTTQATTLRDDLRDRTRWAETLPQTLIRQGYRTAAVGKVFHSRRAADDMSWTDGQDWVSNVKYALPENQQLVAVEGSGPAVEFADVADDAYQDGEVLQAAIAKLSELHGTGDPFFLAVGFYKPHLPFSAPQRFADLYPAESIELTSQPGRPADFADFAAYGRQELEGYYGVPPDDPFDPAYQRHLTHGYYACVSYVDSLIGELLQALDSAGLASDTVVVLVGDHGFHLGEMGEWGKLTNYENATRCPLIFRVPGRSGGEVVQGVVEALDIYPTVVELCGFEPPVFLEGTSLVPQLDAPEALGRDFALSQIDRGGGIRGYTMRTATLRYTEWRQRHGSQIFEQELYFYGAGELESINVANDPAFATIVDEYSETMAEIIQRERYGAMDDHIVELRNGEFDAGSEDWFFSSEVGASYTVSPSTQTALGDDPAAHIGIEGPSARFQTLLMQEVPANRLDAYSLRVQLHSDEPQAVHFGWYSDIPDLASDRRQFYFSERAEIPEGRSAYEFHNFSPSRLSGRDDGAVFFISPTASLQIDSVELFRQQSFELFLHRSRLREADALFFADPDEDGLTNYEEYLRMSEPREAEQITSEIALVAAPPPGQAVATQPQVYLRFERWQGAADIVYLIESTSDLDGEWLPSAEAFIEPGPHPITSVEIPLEPGDPQSRFWRLRRQFLP